MEESLAQNAAPPGGSSAASRGSTPDQNKSLTSNVRVVFPQTGFFTQLWASIIRFTIQQIRDPVSVALQVLLPVLIVGAMAGVSTLSPSEMQAAGNFVNQPNNQNQTEKTLTMGNALKSAICYDDGTFYPTAYTGRRMTANQTGEQYIYNHIFVQKMIRSCSVFYNLPENAILRGTEAAGITPWVCSQDKPREFIAAEGLCGFQIPSFPITSAFLDETKITAIPSIDEMLLIQWAARLIQPFRMPDFLQGPNKFNALSISGFVYVTASSNEQKNAANRLMTRLNESSLLLKNFAYRGMYPNADALTPIITSTGNEGSTWAIINVAKFGDASVPEAERGLDIELNLNRSSAGWTVRPRQRFYNGGTNSGNYLMLLSGFLTLEKGIGEAFGSLLRGSAVTLNTSTASEMLDSTGTPMAIAPMPYAEYRIARFLETAGSLMPLLLTLTLLYSVSQLVKNIVEEKEKKIRAGMQAMGLGRSVSATSTLLVFIVQGLISSIINTIVLSATFLNLTDGSITFVLFLLFSVSSSCFGVLMSVFFDKARISGIISPIVFLMCAIPSVAIPQDSAPQINRVLSFLSPSAFSLGMRNLVQYEQVQGMGWGDMGNPLDEVPMGFVLFMLLLDCFLYYFLALYLDNIMKKEWGITRPCCFCFTDCCHKQNASDALRGPRNASYGTVDANGTPIIDSLTSAYPTEGAVESYKPGDVPVVSFNHVYKRFPLDNGQEKIAVNDLTMHFLEGKINVLLGGNGASKTTSVNLMTGMLSISDGDVTVCGISVRDQPELTQQLIGVCPQHNLLWDSLSCMHHLLFYARIKGMPSDLAEKRGLQLLKILDLYDKRDQTSSELSGGQKRRLSVAIAFVAGSPLVVLDECTAGMDVPSRRGTWFLLNKMVKSRALGVDFETGEKLFDEPEYLKTGCSILLITHFMDEADILGDRITIMSAGQLHSFGTPEYLKNRLGRGYALRFTTKQALPPNEVQHMLNDMISQIEMQGATIAEAKGQEVMIRVPNSIISRIPAALRTFNNPNAPLTQKYKVEAVGVEVSTMEDVFLRIAEEEENRRATLESKDRGEFDKGSPITEIDGKPISMLEANETLPKSIRDAIEVCFEKGSEAQKNTEEGKHPGGSFFAQFVALCLKRLNFMKRDRRTLIFQLLVPIVCVLLGMALTGISPPDSGRLTFDTMYDPEPQEIPYTASTCDQSNGVQGIPLNSSDTKAFAVYSPVVNGSQFSSYLLENARKRGNVERNTGWVCSDQQHLTSMSSYNIDSCSPIDDSANENSSTCLKPTTLMFYNFSSAFGSAFGLNNWIGSQVDRIQTAASQPTVGVSYSNKPLPFSSREQSNLDTISLLLGALFVSLPFGFVPSSFVSFIVREREIRAKMMQRLSGVNFGAFWLAHSVFDFVTFLFTELLTLIIFAALDHPEYVGKNAIGIVLVLFLLNAAATTGLGYCLSFLFDSHASAQTFTMLIGFLSGFVMVIFGFVLESLDAGGVRFVFRLFPPYCFGEALVAIAIAHSQEKSFNIKIDRWGMENGNFTQAGYALLFLGIEAIIAYVIVFLIEFKSIWLPILKGNKGSKEFTPNPVPPSEDESWDVQEERKRTEENSVQPDGKPFPLQVKQLRKVYHRNLIHLESDNDKKNDKSDYGAGRVVAVKNLSFSVEQGTIFGLCGTNGAGKTSTMEIIVGANDATAGDCYINGHSVTHEGNITRQYIGYCPQFDALFDLLTCREHLKLYCAIRGVEPAKQDLVCNGLMEAVGLREYKDVIAMSLSGGNKRKLSVAISLVGGPKLLLLDEMSAGIDTHARRILWSCLDAISSKCAIVLTTHHLEEVEALAHSVGIMVPGKFACLGPLGRIKASVGGGVEIRIRANNADEIDDVQRMLYATAKKEAGLAVETTRELLELVERVEGRVTLRLPAANAAKVGVTSADVFEWLLAMQRVKHFEFTVSNATIEQVFLAIAHDQEQQQQQLQNDSNRLASPASSSSPSTGSPATGGPMADSLVLPPKIVASPSENNNNNNNNNNSGGAASNNNNRQPNVGEYTQRVKTNEIDDFL